MANRVSHLCRLVLFATVGFTASMSAAAGQTTLTLNQSKAQVVYATIRAGVNANTNYPTILKTRAADTTDNYRRALIKFDTQNTIPAGTSVTSALMTLTVKTGSAVASRNIGAYQVTRSWTETETTWKLRRTGENWVTAGGDLGSLLAQQAVSNVAGTKVTFDVTALVRQAVSGALGSSRYTRLALVDLNSATTDTTREFYTPDDSDPSRRPVLRVVYGTATTAPAPTGATTATLRVLDWNSHHGGVGTDGVLDADRFMKKAASFRPDVV